MSVPYNVEIKLQISGIEIVGVEASGKDVEVSVLTPDERELYSKSSYGLKPVDTLYETQITQSATKCFMVIGGFKVRVPCP